jgi:hypothetical protein
MRTAFALSLAVALGACAHADVAVDSRSAATSGSSVTTGGVGLHVSGNAMAAVLAAGVIVAGTLSERDDPPSSGYHSISEWFSGPAAPKMDPRRRVSERDCTQPMTPEEEKQGNLRCR